MLLRLLVVPIAAYTFGHPIFDGQRPEIVDRPLRILHRTVNDAPAEFSLARQRFDTAMHDLDPVRNIDIASRALRQASR